MYLPRFQSPLLVLAGLLAWLGLASISSAQLAVNIVTNKKELIPYEPILVGIEMTNRSAKPILLATPNDDGGSWIKWTVANDRGSELPLTGIPDAIAPVLLRPGQTYQHTVNVGKLFPMRDFGGYAIQANVYVPPDRAYAPSNRQRVNVVGAREIWSTAFGVPVGKPDGGGTSRIFRLLQLRTLDKVHLYARLDDRSSGQVISCLPIGATLDIRPPTYTVDDEGNLHVLHQANQNISYHVVVDSSGKLVRRDAHADVKGSRPTLAAAADNSIGVIGGRPYDPQVERIRRLSVRRISERPSGLNELLGRGASGAAAPGTDTNYQPLTPPARP